MSTSSIQQQQQSNPLLTEGESERLTRLEQTIVRGMGNFVEVGQALLEIRDERLYREVSDTFAGYCQIKWGFTSRRAEQLMQAAETVGEIADANANHGSHLLPAPKNERQVRPLGELPKGERAEAFAEAAEAAPTNPKTGEKKVTGKGVAKVVARRKAKESAKAGDQPWSEFNEQVAKIASALRSVHREMLDVLEADTQHKQLKGQFAREYSYAGTVEAVLAIVRTLEKGMPSVACDRPPGYLTVWQASQQQPTVAA